MTEELTSRFNLTTSSGFGRVHRVLVFHGMESNLARDISNMTEDLTSGFERKPSLSFVYVKTFICSCLSL